MRAHNFVFLLRQGTRNVFSNKLMSFASIGVLIACFLLIGSAVLFTLDINRMADYIGDQNEVVVFLEDDLSQEDIEVVDLEIRQMDNILERRFYTKEENLRLLSEKLGETPEDLLTDPEQDNPLVASYELRIKDPANFAETITLLEGIEGVLRVDGSAEVAKTLVAIRQTVFYAGTGIVVILVVVSVAIITNTIKLTVFSRRKEINIMKYVGATDGFIRFPFVVEGMLIGIVAAAVSFLILGLGYTYLLQYLWEHYQSDFILGFFLANAVEFKEIAVYVFGGFAGLGCVLGMISSGFFVRKYLRV
ncbi:permease-like cell division protein FtsX [Ruminococcaceae bacterium OttesenSCG-928-L11]|nr:permease-like cell division protein FtsX [Ruminococcaceae bacterium OttesenSCG-928-L11]